MAGLFGLACTLTLSGCGGSGGSSGGTSPDTGSAPAITAQPAAASVAAGSTATFTVTATGSASLTYQWQRDGSNLVGATTASYTTAALTTADNGAQFQVVVSNGAGSATSSPATLAVTALPSAPVIVSQPVGITLTAGTGATFTVLADGNTPLGFQWQRDGVNISGATAASYTVPSTVTGDSGANFRVIVSNPVGSTISANALLTVADSVTAPSIVTQPQSASVVDGGSAILSVAATGTGPFGYQWRRGGVAIPGATLSTLVTPALTPADSGAVYSVVVTNGGGSATSANATVTVNLQPVALSVNPVAASVAQGQTALFAAVATGSQPVTYQWRRNGTAIAGATSPNYTTPATTLADDGALYSVVATNPANSVTSAAVRLTVTGAVVAPTIATAPANVSVSEGQTATFNVTAAGTGPLSYQWRRNAVDITGARSASYTTPATVIGDNSARYSVRVTNSAGSVTSTEATLTVQAASSVLIGRAWTTGQPLESDDNSVLDHVSGIDDAGRVTVVFRKTNGTRDVIYATRGTPNAAGTAPTWTAPVAIDVLGATPVSSMFNAEDYSLVVAPGGNAAAFWYHTAPCTSNTYRTTTTCRFYYLARYIASTGNWSQPELIGDAPSPNFTLKINDRGDVALLGTSWVRSGTAGSTAALAIFLRNQGETGFRRQLLNSQALGSSQLHLDAAGNVLVAVEAQQGGTTDIGVFRGTVAAGLGSLQVLDTRGAAATLDTSTVGLNGQQALIWTQNNGVQNTTFAAVSSTPTGTFALTDLQFVGSSTSIRQLIATDDGRVFLYNLQNAITTGGATRRDWSATTGWAASVAMPAGLNRNLAFSTLSFTRSGDFLLADTLGCCSNGGWATYDAGRNVLVSSLPTAPTGPGYVLGFARSGVGYGSVALSLSGIGFVPMQNTRDVLPTPSVPAGDGRTGVTNLWGVYFK